MLANLTNLLALKFRNLRTLIQYGKRHSFNQDRSSNLFFVQDGAQKHYFGVMRRGFSLYRYGLEDRGSFLANSYCLSHINFDQSDVVIDCGANYGDLFLFLKDKIQPENYISVEPGNTEHQCLIRNAPRSTHVNKGLGNTVETKTFFLNERYADSSIIEPPSYSEKLDIDVTTLDALVNEYQIRKIKLLKLEAEGYEPEIIQGSLESLNKIEFIALDGSCERGIEERGTFSEICNVLFDNNYELVDTNCHVQRALFKNKLPVNEFN